MTKHLFILRADDRILGYFSSKAKANAYREQWLSDHEGYWGENSAFLTIEKRKNALNPEYEREY